MAVVGGRSRKMGLRRRKYVEIKIGAMFRVLWKSRGEELRVWCIREEVMRKLDFFFFLVQGLT